MSAFSPEEFMVEPNQSTFEQLRKDDLILLGKHLKLKVKSPMRKREIQKLIMEHLVHVTKSFEQSVLSTYTQEPNITLELGSNPSIDKEKEGVSQIDKERQWQKEQEEIAWQREREKREWEREEREFRLKEQERECRLKEQEIELQKLQLQSQNKSSSESTQYFDVTKHIRMVPPFQEREVDKYFLHFEKVAANCHWPKESWTMLLQSVLVGKAREIFSQLSVEDSANFDTVKELILKGYELVPEAYRQKFRNLTKPSSKTFIEFAQEKAQLFDRWCTSENINNKYDSLRELI